MSPHLIIIIVLSVCSLIISLLFIVRRKKEYLIKLCDQNLTEQQREDIIELIKRYEFFAGPNLIHFEKLLKEKDLSGAEAFLEEKFKLQNKANTKTLAHKTLQKLIHSTR